MLPYISVLTYRKLKLILSDQTVTSPSDDIIIICYPCLFQVLGVMCYWITSRSVIPEKKKEQPSTPSTVTPPHMLRLKKVRQLSTTVSTLPRITVELISDTM